MSQLPDFCGSQDDDENIYINERDGLANVHPLLPFEDSGDEDLNALTERQGSVDSDSFDDLPTSLIVTNLHPDAFIDDKEKEEIENLFKFFSPSAKFQWFRSFKRMRVNFDDAVAAATARIQLHQYKIGKSVINCYFAQPVTPVANKYLRPPAPFKQYLISPPASPPTGWEPREEGEPLVNHDLLAALANLMPGESHELHPQSKEHPGIIIHTARISHADDDVEIEVVSDHDQHRESSPPMKPTIAHTRCPDRN